MSSIPGEHEACTAELRLIAHEITLSFAMPGTKTLHIHGRHVDINVDEEIMIPKQIVVQ